MLHLFRLILILALFLPLGGVTEMSAQTTNFKYDGGRKAPPLNVSTLIENKGRIDDKLFKDDFYINGSDFVKQYSRNDKKYRNEVNTYSVYNANTGQRSNTTVFKQVSHNGAGKHTDLIIHSNNTSGTVGNSKSVSSQVGSLRIR